MIGIMLLVIGAIMFYILINLFNMYFLYRTIFDKEYMWSVIPIIILFVCNGAVLFILGI